jgi:transcriptional regulator with XRE-family HTH domain
MPGISDALEQIRKLKPGETLSYRKLAEKHGVDRTTLSRAHRGVQGPQHVAHETKQKLSNQQEEDLVKYIEQLTARHIPPTRLMVRNFASSVASTPCSDSWVTRFLHHHHDRLTSQ